MRFSRFWRSALPIVVTMVSVVGFLVAAAPANADPGSGSGLSDAARYKCGSQCNGKQPSWVIPSNGVQCVNSKSEIASGHPAFDQTAPIDYSVTVHVYYSSVCQTMWETISRIAASPDTSCAYALERTVTPYYDHTDACPAKGHSLTTPMMDDANGGAVAGYVNVISQWYASDGSFHGGIFEKKY
jgi:hypothetical protein